MSKKIFPFFWDNFIAGVVVILPISITLFIIRFLVINLNSIMLNPMALRLTPYLREDRSFLFAKMLIFGAAILIIIFIGLMTRVIIVRRTFSFFEKLFYKLPMVNKIYGAIKDISNAFIGNKKSGFKKVVLIEYPRKGVYTLGFVTSEAKGQLQDSIGDGDLLNIYIPTTPNPTSGIFILYNKQDVIPLDLSVEEALKVVISAGAIAPPHREKVEK